MIMQSIKTSVARWELLAALGIVMVGVSSPTVADEKAEPRERNIQFRVGPDGRRIAVEVANVPDSPAFARFASWLKNYTQAPAAQKAALEAEGVRLATERRKPMAEMIERDPKRALELAIYPAQRTGLPVAVLAQLEVFVQGRGTYRVFSGSAAPRGDVDPQKLPQLKKSSHKHAEKLSFGGQVYQVHTYGRRAGLMTKSNLPFYGVAIGEELALHESPLRILAKGETPPTGAVAGKDGALCPVCKKSTIGGLVGVLGTTLYYFDSQQHADEFIEQLWALEDEIGPNAHG